MEFNPTRFIRLEATPATVEEPTKILQMYMNRLLFQTHLPERYSQRQIPNAEEIIRHTVQDLTIALDFLKHRTICSSVLGVSETCEVPISLKNLSESSPKSKTI